MSLFKMTSFLKGLVILQGVIGMGHSYLVDMKRLTSPQVKAMQKLRDLMEKEGLEVKPHMTENYSLAKWLHFHGFNVEATCDAIKKNIQWRTEENMDNILKEDWSDMLERFPYTRDTCDKEGRPILFFDSDKWDIASYLAQGKEAQDRFMRYIAMCAEETEALVWEWCQAGTYVTQGTVVVNMVGFSTAKHACLSCLQVFRKLSFIIGENYPNTRNHIILLGTPLLFRAVYYVFPPAAQNNMTLIGHDRHHWESALLENIAPDQIPQGLLEYLTPLKPGTPATLPATTFPESKYTNYGSVRQRSADPVDTLYPFLLPLPGMSPPGYGRLWKREL